MLLSLGVPSFSPAAEAVDTDLTAAEIVTAADSDVVWTYKLNSSDEATLVGYTLADGVSEIRIPDTLGGHRVGEIADDLFAGDARLVKVFFGSSITHLGSRSFQNCTNLQYAGLVTLEELAEIPMSCFAGCTSLKEISLPSKVTNIGDGAFSGCTSLQKADLNAAGILRQINTSAFAGCKALASIEVPASVQYIEARAFANCSQLASIRFRGTTMQSIGMEAFKGCTSLEELHLPDNLSTARVGAFDGCSGLKFVSFGKKTPNTVAGTAFINCDNIELMAFPVGEDNYPPTLAEMRMAGWKPSIAYLCIGYDAHDKAEIRALKSGSSHKIVKLPVAIGSHPIVIIRDTVALDDTDLREVVFPEGCQIETIEFQAFHGCTSLKKITIPASVKRIQYSAFKECSSLEEVKFETTKLSALEGHTFYGCTHLKSITVPDGVTMIAGKDFYNCHALKTVHLPDSLTYIGPEVFACDNLPGFGSMSIETMRMPNAQDEMNIPIDAQFFYTWPHVNYVYSSKLQITYGSWTDAIYRDNHLESDVSRLKAANFEYVPVSLLEHTGSDDDPQYTAVLSWDTVVNYTGSEIKPEVTVTRWLRTDPVGAPTYLKLEYPDVEYVSPGTHHIKVTGVAPYFKDSRTIEFQIAQSNLDDVQMQDVTGCVWDNQKWEPHPTFYVEKDKPAFPSNEDGDSYTLEEHKDYEIVEYKHNKLAGTAMIKIEGKGGFTGTKEFNFTISPAEMKADTVQVEVADQVYTGEAVKPVPDSVLLKNRNDEFKVKLDKDVDYVIESYQNNTSVGVATMVIKPIENCGWLTGKTATSFNIVPADLADATVQAIPDQTYTGSAIEPDLKVSMGQGELVKDRDYTVTWKNNKNVGTAQATIKAKGIGCRGEKTIEFQIVPKPVTVTPDNVSKTYGEADPPLTATVEGTVGGDSVVYSLLRTPGESADLYKIWALGASSQGNYAVTFGDGAFFIDKASITDAEFLEIEAVTYDGEAHEPAPEVTWNGRTLTKGEDYTLDYANNVNAGQATVVVQGAGNFKDEARPEFTISPLDLRRDGCQVLVGFQMHTGQPLTPHPARVTAPGRDGKTLVLVEGMDYAVHDGAWRDNVDVGTGHVKISGIGNFCESREGAFNIVNDGDLGQGHMNPIGDQAYIGKPIEPDPRVFLDGVDLWLVRDVDYTLSYADNVNVGTATVTAKPAEGSSLTGRAVGTFEITPADIGEAKVEAESQMYDGTEHRPSPTITWRGEVLDEETDYTIRYQGNVDAGTASVIAEGKGNFAGTASGTFEIAKRQATITVDDATKVRGEADPPFTGTVEGLVAAGDLGEVKYIRANDDEDAGTYPGVLTVEFTANPNYDVSVKKGDFTITMPGYSVRFAANVPKSASTICTGSMGNQAFAYDERKALSPNAYSLPGYDFTGWNTKADGTGTTYSDAEEVKSLSENGGVVTLYAQWSAKEYSIVFNPGEVGGNPHVQTARFDQPGKLDAYSDAAFSWSSGGRTLHGWAGTGFGSFFGDGADFVNLCGAPRADGSLAARELVAEWLQGGEIVVTVTKDGVPQPGLADHLALTDGSGTTFAVPIWYERRNYVFDPTAAVAPGGQAGQLPPGEYDIEFEASGYPAATAHITYGEANATSVVLSYYTVSLAKDAAHADAHEVAISGGAPVAGEPNTVIALDGSALNINTSVDEGYRFAGYTAVGVAPEWEGDDPTKAGQEIHVRGEAAITANVEPIEYAVSVEGGAADASTATLGTTVTITADEPEPGYAFVQWSGPEGVDFASADSLETTFAMPAKDVTVEAVFAPIAIEPIGDKVYNGAPIEPIDEVRVSLEGVDLIVGQYDVEFKDNLDAGTATLTVTLEGPRTGSATATFEILPASISEATVEAEGQVYDGAEHRPSPAVTWREKALAEGEDFEVTAYAGNVGAGTATVTVTGKGNFAGAASGTFEIAKRPATITVDDAVKIQGEADPAFTGAVEGLVGEGDLGEVSYRRVNDAEAPGTYEGVLTAVYAANPNYGVTVVPGDFTIKKRLAARWLDGDGSLLQEKTYAEGDEPPAYDGREPTRAATAQYTYAFAGWDGGTVDGATTTYRPLFSETVNSYEVTWLQDDGELIDRTIVEYGVKPAHADPTKPATAEYTYTFAGWAPEVVAVTGDATYKATYTENPVPKPTEKGTLTFDLGGGTLDGKTDTITIVADVGDVIKLPGAPTREGYTFKFWRGSQYKAGADYKVEGDHAFTAEWEKNAPAPVTRHTVTFDANGHGTAPASQEVEDGKTAAKPADPMAAGWTFGGWFTDKSCTNAYDFSQPVTADMMLYAKWTQKSTDDTKGAPSNSTAGTSPKTGDRFGGVVAMLSVTAACALCLALFAGSRRRRNGRADGEDRTKR